MMDLDAIEKDAETGVSGYYYWIIRELIALVRKQEAEPAEARRVPIANRTEIARAIWNLRRIHTGDEQYSLEEMQAVHPVWAEADAVMAVLTATAPVAYIFAGRKYELNVERVPAAPAPAQQDSERKCEVCQGNDGDAPCAYPSENMAKCLRRINLTAGVFQQDSERDAAILADANRYQQIKRHSFNRTMMAFDGPVLTWSLTIAAADDEPASLDAAIDQERGIIGEKPYYPAMSVPAQSGSAK